MNAMMFFDDLQRCRIFDADRVMVVRGRFDSAVSAADIAATLQDEGLLTSFQARQLLDGRGQQLVLGQYHLLAELGSGGFGRVFKARHVYMNRIVALKVIAPALVENERTRTWFRREVLAATHFDHPHIVRALDANEVDGQLFLVLELVDGQDLEKMVRRQGPLAIDVASEIVRQAAMALEHAHLKGAVHRDVKPANLLIQSQAETNLQVKLTDFGLSRLHREIGGQTLAGLRDNGVVGTPEFISPEQARNIHDADLRSDLYSLGCTWYFAVTGRSPFRGNSAVDIIDQQINAKPIRPEIFRPDLPTSVGDAIMRLLVKSRDDRFQSAAELIETLDGLLIKPSLAGTIEKADSRVPCIVRSPCETIDSAVDDSVNEVAVTKTVMPATDKRSETVTATAELRRIFEDWAWFVHAVNLESLAIPPIARRYRLAHENLIRQCRDDSRNANESTRQFLSRIESLAEPWVSLESLRRNDVETRSDLAKQCRDIERLAFGTSGQWSHLLSGRLFAAALICCVIAASWPTLQARWARTGAFRTFLLQEYPLLVVMTLLIAGCILIGELVRRWNTLRG